MTLIIFCAIIWSVAIFLRKGSVIMDTLLSVSIALVIGLLMTRVVKPLKLPSVTAYLIAGVLIGPYCLGALGVDGVGFVSSDAVSRLALVS